MNNISFGFVVRILTEVVSHKKDTTFFI